MWRPVLWLNYNLIFTVYIHLLLHHFFFVILLYLMHESLQIFTKVTFVFVHRDDNIDTACVYGRSTRSRAAHDSDKCVQKNTTRSKSYLFFSLTEGSGLPCYWSSVVIVCRRPQKAQHDSPAVFHSGFLEPARLPTALCAPFPGDDWFLSGSSQSTMWDGL